MGELSTMMGAFSEDLLEQVIKTLKDQTDQIKKYKTLLTQRLIEAQSAMQRYQIIEKLKQKQETMAKQVSKNQASINKLTQDMDNLNMLSHASDSLVASYGQQVNEFQSQIAEETFQNAILNLYTLEHEIIDFLTKNRTATTKYAIYYDAGDIPEMGQDAKGEFFRGEISPEEVKEFFNVTDSGTIQLHKSKALITKLQNRTNPDGTTTVQKYSTQDVWNKLTMAILGNLQQHLYKWMEDLEILDQAALKEHLGRKRYSSYDTLNKLFGYKNFDTKEQYAASTLTQVYKKYMLTWNENYAGFSLRGLAYNRGHIAEAFERYVVQAGTQSLEPTDDDIIQYLNASVGDLPWFAGGDVGSTQVKALFGDIASVQIASANTICALANELAHMFLDTRGWIEKARERINSKLQKGAKESEPAFSRVEQHVAENLAGRLAKGLGNTYGVRKFDK